MRRQLRRRQFLGALGAAGVTGLAGCTGDGADGGGGGGGAGPGDGSGGGDGGGGDATPTPAGTPWTLPDHDSLTGLDGQPVLGPPPGEAPGLVVAFEDPSCTICQRFERNTWPELESELVATGKVSFVYRVMPITYPWGKPATQALESTYAFAREAGQGRDAPAFWGLKDAYYAERDRFASGDTLAETEAYLASETDLDAEAVVAAAREKRHDDAVQADLAAGNEAGVSATPTFFLFRDGEFETTIRGAQSYNVFATALGF
ncbi:DsbA family protein [Haloglomus litoreum]|uniref:DsbA family protein n=1 Tax=Haloglomus litoreum TaxID=3034026 RepID=UPI0023E76E92|nr:thioredoxin domain-containing protein [Haloglomus sp. DT116]